MSKLDSRIQVTLVYLSYCLTVYKIIASGQKKNLRLNILFLSGIQHVNDIFLIVNQSYYIIPLVILYKVTSQCVSRVILFHHPSYQSKKKLLNKNANTKYIFFFCHQKSHSDVRLASPALYLSFINSASVSKDGSSILCTRQIIKIKKSKTHFLKLQFEV